MSVLSGGATSVLDAPIDRVWAVVQDVGRAPEWQRVLERLDVLEHDTQGRPLICDTVSDAKLTKIRCRVRMRYEPPRRLVWSQIESDDLDWMEGSWELEELDANRTRVTYTLSVDPGSVGILARPLERVIRPFVIGHQARELAAEVARHA
jgi:ribosome-associated toxin RatA of RatAB toxin-antitoxin module